MNTKILATEQIKEIGDCKVFLDTNIWLLLEGVNGFTASRKQQRYERAYSYLMNNGNTLITNEYVLSEICNRSVKLAYELAKKSSGLGDKFMRYKEFRGTDKFGTALEVARDTCLNILSDCEFCSCNDKHYSIETVLHDFARGKMDFSDILITSHCASEKYALMTDDGDYADCAINIVTANRRLLIT